jgi:hypothetical protein
MDKCIKAPAVPEGQKALPFSSMKASCTQNADGSIQVSAKVYLSSGSCSGVGAPVKETIAAGCQDGGSFKCVADMSGASSVSESWPAVGAFFGDSACNHMDVMAAFKANTCAGMSSKDKAGSVQIDNASDSYEGKVWQDVTDCSGEPTKQVTIPKETCQPINTGVATSTYGHALEKWTHMMSKATGCHKKIEKELGVNKVGSGAPVYYYGTTADKVPM